ncbi:unnamed protein product, partial [Ilex paraguariensis]
MEPTTIRGLCLSGITLMPFILCKIKMNLSGYAMGNELLEVNFVDQHWEYAVPVLLLESFINGKSKTFSWRHLEKTWFSSPVSDC